MKLKYGICHKDSKLINRAGGIRENQITILTSPPPKLLAIPSIKKSIGVAQSEAVMNVFLGNGI